VAVLAAIGGPLTVAFLMAERDAQSAELRHMTNHARDMLLRAASTEEQIHGGIASLVALGSPDPCSEESLALMRRIDLGSSFIQAIGHVAGNSIVCSSIGTRPGDLDIGPPDMIHPDGEKVRTSVEFPPVPGTTFVVVERDGFGAIIHKGLVLGTSVGANEVSLALFSLPNLQILTARGEIKPEWLEALDDQIEVAFVDDTHAVAIVASTDQPVAALAAEPKAILDQGTRDAALVLVPIAVIAALGLAFAVLYLARMQLAIPALIKSALRRNEFFLLYQPIAELATGRWVGAEALIRWQRRGGEVMRPDLFIPIAEEAGLIRRITKRVMDLIAIDARDLFRGRPDFYVSVNLSSADLHGDVTVELVDELATAVQSRRGNLMVEATEHSFTDSARANRTIAALRKRGVRVAIDDFGTGYSSLASLATLQLDVLKIDKAFIDTIGTDAATSNVILHIIEMARSLDLELVAEGVETDAQAAFLRAHGVRYAQGYFFAQPMPMADMRAALDAAQSAPSP
jgi:sensor c-di-GMP phosphodiesterase-like protein